MALATGRVLWQAMIELATQEADRDHAAQAVTQRFGDLSADQLRAAIMFGADDDHMEGETVAFRAIALLDQVLRHHVR